MIKIQKEDSTDQPLNNNEYANVSDLTKNKIVDIIGRIEKSNSINKGHLTNVDLFRMQAKSNILYSLVNY
jgi:hypothetical protein